MSTHPRDFSAVSNLSSQYKDTMHIVPCFGVHPWFLHEPMQDSWLDDLIKNLETTPGSIVGEIGLDGHRYDPETGNLMTPMEHQVKVFESQMEIAARLERPVSLHAVLCWGPLVNSLSKLKKSGKNKLPPSIYFHAFGGKVGTVDQLLALCRNNSKAYFGFAPCINFRSPKTNDVIKKIGLDRLVLETDREDAARVEKEVESGIDLLAAALDVSRDVVIERTTANAMELYRLS